MEGIERCSCRGRVSLFFRYTYTILYIYSLIAIGYERKYNEYSRIYQFAKQYLYAPSSAMYSCPLAMTGKKIIGVMLYENLPFF